MKYIFTTFLFIALLCIVPYTQAQEQMLSNSFDSLPIGDLNGQDNWVLTKHDPNKYGTVQITTSDPVQGEKFIEIRNDNSLLVTHTNSPQNTGIFEFKARHNKSGLFYVYAQTSDNGGQLLFSIQFTEASGILLEEAEKQITLLPEYTEDQWYFFSIDFDNTRGERGIFAIQIDGIDYGEYEYVKSESSTFDFTQITIGSESTGPTAVSAFADYYPTALDTASTTPVSDALLLLSITLSSTSISSDLDNGLIVTASFDDMPGVAIASSTATSSETVEVSTSTESDGGSSVGEFIMDIVESVIEIFTPDEEIPLIEPESQPEPASIEATSTIPTIIEPITPDVASPESVSGDIIPEPPAVENVVDEPIPEDEVQSPVPIDDVPNNETITAEF